MMKLEITYNKTVEEVQADFNNCFPFLRLEFLKKGRTIGDINKNITRHTVELPGNTSINELENIFSNVMSLPIRVLRKSGNIWMETSITGNWTLARQNEHGREISGYAV